MEASCSYFPYQNTGYFSRLVSDYLQHDEKLQPFYKHAVSLQGIEDAISARQQFKNDRNLLVQELRKQYESIELASLQNKNLDKLLSGNTFTVCTAHQPNIFTGPLYFIYKILHTIRLAQSLNQQLPQFYFVPVYYMGSEDADLDELGHINLNGEKLEWKTKQTGAVGRMKVDKALVELIERMSGELMVQPHGKDVIDLFIHAYRIGNTIQQATLEVVNALFAHYGLLTLIPDNAKLKQAFNSVVKKEITEQFSHPLVEETTAKISKNYKAQASGREINLFYLVDGVRERIVKRDGRYWVSYFNWQEQEILNEIDEHPERFSANVILRGVFQETILPNVAFIGGGGELAYWLELKKVFEASEVPFPVLILRNSFLLIEDKHKELAGKLGLSITDLFKDDRLLIDGIVKRHSALELNIEEDKKQLQQSYVRLEKKASAIDATLQLHVRALAKQAQKRLDELEKKMLRAERRKFAAEQGQINKLKQRLFPQNNLQERVDNFALYYARYGKDWLEALCQYSLTLEQQFAILAMDNN